jgi:hypothetical protein
MAVINPVVSERFASLWPRIRCYFIEICCLKVIDVSTMQGFVLSYFCSFLLLLLLIIIIIIIHKHPGLGHLACFVSRVTVALSPSFLRSPNCPLEIWVVWGVLTMDNQSFAEWVWW